MFGFDFIYQYDFGRLTDFACINIYCKIKVKGWHEITDIAAILMQEPSVTSQLHYPSDVRTIFMQICTFTRGACFGLGKSNTY